MKIVLVLLFLLGFSSLYAIRISEVFYKGTAQIRSSERYIEIYNDTQTNLDLATIRLVVPIGEGITVTNTIQKGDFALRYQGPQTNTTILPPSRCAVIIWDGYYNSEAKLLPIASNAILLKPDSSVGFNATWTDRLTTIRLLDSLGNTLDSLDGKNLLDSALKSGESYSFGDKGMWIGNPSPGIHNGIFFNADSLILYDGAPTRLYLTLPEATLERLTIRIEYLQTAFAQELTLSRDPLNYYTAWFSPFSALSHGLDIHIRYGSNLLILRHINRKPMTTNFGSVLINEIVTSPQIDYSGGGWTGVNGGGLINDTDDFLELVNTKNLLIDLTNPPCYFLYRRRNSEYVRALSVRFNPASSNNSSIISNFNYLIVQTPSDISSYGTLALYRGHPYVDGELLDYVEFGNYDIERDGVWNNAPDSSALGIEDESLSRFPNAVYDPDFSSVFVKKRASYGRNNGESAGAIWVVVTPAFAKIYLTDTNHNQNTATVNIGNTLDRESLTLTNYGIYYYGEMALSLSSGSHYNNTLQVRNGISNTVLYSDQNPQTNIFTTFYYATEGYQTPKIGGSLDNVMVYPNPASSGSAEIKIANIPKNTDLYILDDLGNLIKSETNIQTGIIVWKETLKRGVYLILLKYQGETAVKKLLSQ